MLGKIRDVVIKYENTDGWRNAFSRAKYGIWEKGGVGDLVAKLEQRTRDLTDSLVIQILLVTNQIRPQIDQIFASARQEEKRKRNQSPAQDTSAAPHPDSSGGFNNPTPVSNQIDVVQSVLERVLHSEQPSNVGLPPDGEDVSIEREIEIQLRQAGIEAKFTRALIDVINKQRKRLAHPEDIDPISYIGGKNRLETPKGWIMVVDSFNEGKIENLDLVFAAVINMVEVRSIIAQAYLEFVRIWTVNHSGEWLFNRVESAGVQVANKFAKRASKSQSKLLVKGGNSPDKAALEAISGKNSFFRSEEKNDILARIAQHRSRGIDYRHFRKFEYMLCFDESVYWTLVMFAKCCKEPYGDLPSYACLPKIILVKGVKLKTAAADWDAGDTSKLVKSIRDGIKSFLNTEYNWQRPPASIRDGPFRTKQIVLPIDGIKLSLDEKETKLNEIASRTNCRIRVTDEKFDSQLFSITGRKEALPFATSLLKEAVL